MRCKTSVQRIVKLFENLVWTCEESALTVIAAAWNPQVFAGKIKGGRYFVPVGRVDDGSAQMGNSTLSKLWIDQYDLLLMKSKGFEYK